jgi:large subunit ribosomal protein L23
MTAAKEKHYHIIRAPIVTEKSTMLGENKLTFQVSVDASKLDVKEAVEAIFNVKVAKVNTMLVKGKRKVFKGKKGKRADKKKAIVTLVDGQTVDVMAGV